MSIIAWLLAIIIIAAIVYIVVAVVRYRASLRDLATSPIDLSTTTNLMNSSDVQTTLFGDGGSSILALVDVRPGNRTLRENIDNFTPLLAIPQSMEFQIAPSKLAAQDASARLVITTNGPSQEKEIVNLPPLPQQKWTQIAILRDGRRFDVMYDDRIVASHRLNYYPAMIPNQLTIGSPDLLGTAIHVLVASYRLSPDDVAKQRATLTDTAGKPHVTNPIPFPLSITPLQTACIPGIPCEAVAKPPPDTLKMWASPYN